MNVVSASKSTILSSFDTLEQKAVYNEAGDSAVDFQFYQKPLMVQINKKSGIELITIKGLLKQDNFKFKSAKVSTELGYSVCCSKTSSFKFAVGTSNGLVKLYNLREDGFYHTFKSDYKNCVTFVDYNCTGDYIAAVIENKQIDIYSLKTQTKSENFTFDSHPTVARFHPKKRSILAAASFKGTIIVYDTQVKRKTIHCLDAHKAPCRDLSIPKNDPDTMLTVGYDCTINIFDFRYKSPSSSVVCSHPLSTVATSDCGKFFCVGSLKGEVSCYDMRNFKTHITSKLLHDSSVERVAFVPPGNEVHNDFFEKSGVNSSSPTESNEKLKDNKFVKQENPKPVAKPKPNTSDSFADFLEYQVDNSLDKSKTPRSRRDSFDWETLVRSSNGMECSLPGGNKLPLIASISTLTEDDSSTGEDILKKDAIVPPPLRERNIDKVNIMSKQVKQLKQIEEEELPAPSTSPKTVNNSNSSSDKENNSLEAFVLANEYLFIEPDTKEVSTQTEYITADQFDQPAHPIQFQIDNLRSEMNERFKELLCESNCTADTNKWQYYTQTFNLWKEQMKVTERVDNNLITLMQSTPLVMELRRLKTENIELQEQLQEALSKLREASSSANLK
ncbi:uncharacterized protein LOC119689864 [Teleopsis dalmanni]|uniref:uncharacterized protein LOC119689864 n=1 Tax=Teleopsis dalmanni TaxID=139649 RepID=UPI000D32B8F6|nr:uncharacterized protein LOC119689864 [Teleopsis dalmanni]